jgi:eukaryotic-like serine/threonine-protein kinase
MTPERYRKIGELFHAALELGADGRAAFFERECAGDAELRREVESLIRSHEGGGGVIDEPALSVAAGLLAEDTAEQVIGQTLAGRYRVLSLLGAGGMGRVYLAEDAGLCRRVALKFLPEHLTHDAEQVRRFRQEARAASALNHPNIITVYEINEAGGASVIASEYIEGETLRARLSRGAMPPAEALEVAAQMASALRAAHEAGIVHRDVKPENVMLRPDGYVKVLDFGIAKLAPHRTNTAEGNGHNISTVRTHPGLIMGTDRYMSPEQARGREVDARADVWSLGCVLYEMLSGAPPFTGETASDVVAAVLKTEPAPLPQVAAGTPGELQRIVGKCLEKDREERYPSAEELFADLRRLQKRLEAGDAGGERPLRFVLTARGFLSSRRRRAVALTALLLVIVGLVATPFWRRSSAPAQQPEIKSLAVLPLKSLDRGAGEDYLGLGIADTIITKVSQAGGLTVRPTSAVRRYADEEVDSLEAARQLRADSVLDGTFLRSGDRLRVSVNLLRTSDGSSLWAESFDVRFTDIFAIQDEVSKEVAARLRLKLSPAEQARLARRHTADPEAYSYYTKAMYHFGKRPRNVLPQEETEIAIDLLKKGNYPLDEPKPSC